MQKPLFGPSDDGQQYICREGVSVTEKKVFIHNVLGQCMTLLSTLHLTISLCLGVIASDEAFVGLCNAIQRSLVFSSSSTPVTSCRLFLRMFGLRSKANEEK